MSLLSLKTWQDRVIRNSVVSTFVALGLLLGWQPPAFGQFVELGHGIPYMLDSGRHDGGPSVAPVFSDVVSIADVPWVILHFEQVVLGPNDYIEMTSLQDGGTQQISAWQVADGQVSSALFNGEVQIALYVGPGGNRSGFTLYAVSIPSVVEPSVIEKQLCPPDDRTLVDPTDLRVCAVVAVTDTADVQAWGTGFFIEGGSAPNPCMLTAGHVIEGGSCLDPTDVNRVWCNIPCPFPFGVGPPTEDQYDFTVVDSECDPVIDTPDDWALLRVSASGGTGSPYYPLTQGEELDTWVNQTTIIGHGVDTHPQGDSDDCEGNCTGCQQKASNRARRRANDTIDHEIDTEQANSGSPILMDPDNPDQPCTDNCRAWGIHTAGATACPADGEGTWIMHNDLADAIDTYCAASLGADLALEEVDAPSGTFRPGDHIIIPNRTRNIGDEPSPTYEISLYASTNTTITESDRLLFQFDRPSLAPGEATTRNSNGNLPTDLAPGWYYIGGILSVSDADQSNNTNHDPTPLEIVEDGTPAIARSPSSLTQSVPLGQNAASQTFTVRNSGAGTLSYTIADNATWLSVSPSGGTSTGETDTIRVNYSTSGLATGNYSATITITASGATNSPQTIGVTLIVSQTDDSYEPNDTRATAFDLSDREHTWLSTINGRGTQCDDDWYRILVSPSGYEHVRVVAEFTDAEGDIDIELYDSSGVLLAYSDSVTDDELIEHTVAGPGQYYIRVYFGDECNSYDLWWDDLRGNSQCRSGQLKAASRYCKKGLSCYGKFAKRPDRDVSGIKLYDCLMKAALKFESDYRKTANRAARAGSSCDLDESTSDVSVQFLEWIDFIGTESLVDWNSFDRLDNGVRGHLLKGAGSFCGKLLSAESSHQKKPSLAKRDAVRNKARAKFVAGVGKKIAAAERRGLHYDGPGVSGISDLVEDVAELVSDAVRTGVMNGP